MIQPNELRIGNKVKCKISNDAGIYEIIGMPMWGMDGFGDGREPLIMIDRCPKQLVPPSKLKAIQITPEILEQYGFEKSEYEGREQWLSPWIERVQPHTKYRLGIFKSESFNFYIYGSDILETAVKSLHHLQNIYFALTGEELNTTP